MNDIIAFDDQYTSISDEIEKEMDTLEKENCSKSTQLNTTREVNHFKAFLAENNLSAEIEQMPSSVLGRYLRFYYFKLQRKDGKVFSPRTLIGKRAAIQRYISDKL